MTTEGDTSYIDYDIFLSPAFSPASFANTLVLGTNNPTDTPLDLATPLSRVLFDAQEIDTHIDNLTSKSAVPLLSHTQEQTAASEKIIQEIGSQVATLNDGYKRLEKEVIVRYETAEEIKQVASRLLQTVRLGRSVGRCLQLGRQLEIQVGEAGIGRSAQREDHRSLLRCTHTILSLRELTSNNGPGEEGYGLEKIEVVKTLRSSMVIPAERSVLSKSQQIMKEFSVSSLNSGDTTYAQTLDAKARLTSAMLVLYLLSPMSAVHTKKERWEPELLIQSLQDYLRASLTKSLSSLVKALSALPNLDRSLLEISARCQNLLALESLLASTKPPLHPLLPSDYSGPPNLLQPLLASLETGSLPSFFWRSLAGALSSKVQEILTRGGVSARTLRSNKNSVKDAIRDCVIRGVQPSSGVAAVKEERRGEASWEREVAVMVGSVLGPLGR